MNSTFFAPGSHKIVNDYECLVLFRLSHIIVFGLGRIPQGEWDHEGRRGHDGEGDPIENMGGEFAVESFEGHDAALSGAARVSKGGLASVFRGQITVDGET